MVKSVSVTKWNAFNFTCQNDEWNFMFSSMVQYECPTAHRLWEYNKNHYNWLLMQMLFFFLQDPKFFLQPSFLNYLKVLKLEKGSVVTIKIRRDVEVNVRGRLTAQPWLTVAAMRQSRHSRHIFTLAAARNSMTLQTNCWI